MLTRLDNFGQGGVNYDLFETGLGASQWSTLMNVDIRDGDLYAAGSDEEYTAETPCVPLYVFLYEVEGVVVDLVSDGDTLYASADAGAWTQIGANLGGGPVGFTVFRGCLIINTSVGPFYWCSAYGNQTEDDSWDGGQDVSWAFPDDTTWVNSSDFEGDTWANGPNESWDGGSNDAWDGFLSGSITALPGWPSGATALQIIAYKDQLVAIGGTDANRPSGEPPYLVRWSSLAPAGSLPDTWEPEEGNFAGFGLVQDTQGHLSGAALMRDDLILYKTDSIWRLSATGDPTIPMRLERIMTCNGIESADAICVCSEVHFGVTKRGFLVFDGNQVNYLDFARVQSEVIDVLVGDAFKTVQVRYFPPQHEVWIAFRYPPDAESFYGILKFNTQHNSFTYHDYRGYSLMSLASGRVSESVISLDSWGGGQDASWDGGEDNSWDDTSPAASADAMVYGFKTGSSGRLAKYDFNGAPTYYDGKAKATELLRYGIRLDGSSNLSVVRGIFPEMEGDEAKWAVGLTWYPGQEQSPSNIRWQQERSFTPASRRKIPTRIVGDTFALRMRGTGRWRLHAVTINHETAGGT